MPINDPIDPSAKPVSDTLVADIGGTNARFALSNQVNGVPSLECVRVLKCADFASIDDAIVHYLELCGLTHCSHAGFAVAGPVSQQIVTITNNHWSLDKQALPARHGFSQFKLVNDFTAMALGTSCLDDSQLVDVNLGHSESHADLSKPRLVVGPGTGLGVSALVPVFDQAEAETQGETKDDSESNLLSWIPLSTEGGHIAFAPSNEYEMKILNYLQLRFGRVSVERILCGEGLSNLYEACSMIENSQPETRTPEAITAEALVNESALAHRVVSLFCKILGQVVGDATLLIGAQGGVYICGGIIPRIITLFQQSEFRTAFEDKGRMNKVVASIPTYVVTEPLTGLLGAALTLSNRHV